MLSRARGMDAVKCSLASPLSPFTSGPHISVRGHSSALIAVVVSRTSISSRVTVESAQVPAPLLSRPRTLGADCDSRRRLTTRRILHALSTPQKQTTVRTRRRTQGSLQQQGLTTSLPTMERLQPLMLSNSQYQRSNLDCSTCSPDAATHRLRVHPQNAQLPKVMGLLPRKGEPRGTAFSLVHGPRFAMSSISRCSSLL